MNPLREAKENEYAKIELKYSCIHEARELRHRTIKGGAKSYVRQCIRCGNTSQPVKKEIALAELGEYVVPAYDNDLEVTWRNRKSAEYEKVNIDFRSKREDDYGAYLSSETWLKKRKKILARANDICEGCGEKVATEVHHISYEHIGKEFLFELVAVCSECHHNIHDIKKT